MALRALLLGHRLTERREALQALEAMDADFEARESAFAAAIEELNADTPAEDRAAFEQQVEAFEQERTAHNAEIDALRAEIAQLEADLAAEETRQNTNPPAAAAPAQAENERRENTNMSMNIRARSLRDMSIEQREAFLSRQDVRDFLGGVRRILGGESESRAISNVGLTIPEVILPMLREVAEANSVLIGRVNHIHVAGEGRQVIMGGIPEAVWTDCCAQLNELTLGFYGMEFDCYKVGGFFALCNATIEDSDLNLLAEVVTALGRAIGKAVDKSILYGRSSGTKMPQGIVTRLAQQSQPESYPVMARPWVDLHSTNIRTINGSGMTGVQLLQALAGAVGYAKHKYTTGPLTWVMNEKTWMTIVSAAIAQNAAGALVSGVDRTMPVLGGSIVILDDMADNDIVAGYFDLYTLAERAGVQIAASTEVRFLQDQTVVKGTARYDGAPVIAEAFVAINIGNSSPATTATFAADGANTVAGILLPATASVASGATITLPATLLPLGVEAAIAWESATTGKATVNSSGVVTGVASGSSVITATSGGKTATCTVTVTSA